MVWTPVKGRAGDDINDGGNDRNCTVVICTFLFFFGKIAVKIPWNGRLKLGKSICHIYIYHIMLYHNETVILCPESFVEKFRFFCFKHKLVRVCWGHCLSRFCTSVAWRIMWLKWKRTSLPHPSPKIATRAWPRRWHQKHDWCILMSWNYEEASPKPTGGLPCLPIS